MNKIFLVAFVLLFVAPAFSFTWSSCGTSSDDFAIQNVTISPDPPVKGGNTSITAVGTMKKEVTGGTNSIVVKYGFITVLSQTTPLCTAPIVCPIEPGPFNGQLPPVSIQAVAPNGNYKGTVTIKDQDNSEVACVNFEFALS